MYVCFVYFVCFYVTKTKHNLNYGSGTMPLRTFISLNVYVNISTHSLQCYNVSIYIYLFLFIFIHKVIGYIYCISVWYLSTF